MATPSKQEQESESRARQEAGIEPQLNAGALDVVDDAAPGEPAPPPVREPAEEPGKAKPPVKSAFDTKRADIVSRFRTSRTEDVDAVRDDISDFARSGMPPEFEPPAPPLDEPAPSDQTAEPEPAARAPTTRVKVRGQDIELSHEDLIAHAQKSLAAETYLDDAKGKLKEIDTLLRETRDRGARPAPADPHQVRPQSTQSDDQQQTTDQVDGNPDTTDTPINRLIEALQFGGDSEETRTLMRTTIAEEAQRVVRAQLQNDRLRDEGARSNKVLADFLGQHADIAADPMARAAIEYKLFELQVEDLKALGVDPAQIQTATGAPPTPGDIAQAHRWYRAEGMQVRSPKEMLETATADFVAWKGIKAETPADPAAKAAPRVDISVERAARRQAIPQQPSRTAVPRQGGEQPAPQARDRSDIVASMAQKRGLPRGKIVA